MMTSHSGILLDILNKVAFLPGYSPYNYFGSPTFTMGEEDLARGVLWAVSHQRLGSLEYVPIILKHLSELQAFGGPSPVAREAALTLNSLGLAGREALVKEPEFVKRLFLEQTGYGRWFVNLDGQAFSFDFGLKK